MKTRKTCRRCYEGKDGKRVSLDVSGDDAREVAEAMSKVMPDGYKMVSESVEEHKDDYPENGMLVAMEEPKKKIKGIKKAAKAKK